MKVNHNFTAVNHVPLKASNLLKSIYSKRCATNSKTTTKELMDWSNPSTTKSQKQGLTTTSRAKKSK
jgi:hypothetical protein